MGHDTGCVFTRWVTHFCAPAFVFLAGSAAFLHGRKLGNRSALARYLVTRGLILVVLELTLIRIAWTFNFDFAHYLLAGVIWMIGWCMAVMAALIWLPPAAIATFGFILTREPAERRRLCITIGGSAIALFLVLRGLDVYGDPRHWRGAADDAPPALFRFLNTSKYPASLLFLLMTLGPMIALLPLAERARGAIGRALTVFGRVPFFYYLLHIPLIHATAMVVSRLREGHVNPWLFENHPMMAPPPPDGYTWSLPLLYLVFAIVLALLYGPCRWFAGLKARSDARWLKYV